MTTDAPIANPRRIPFAAEYAPDDFARIRGGLRPEVMEDKWLIRYQDGVLTLHRSWTGHCIYRVTFEEKGGRAVVASAEVNRDPEQYAQTDDAYDAKLLGWLIDALLLGRPADFPVPPDIGGGDAALYGHAVAGRGAKIRKPWWKFW